MSKQKMVLIISLLTIGLLSLVGNGGAAGSGDLVTQCSTAIQQLTSCISYASGKAIEPTKECCSSISSMRDKQPVCLCYFIGQAHNGTEAIKSLGIQEAKLLQLPSACHLVNATISDCPKLLGISPSSPAAAIFNNASSTSSSPMTPGSSDDKSNGYMPKYNALFGSLVTIFVSLCISSISFFGIV